MIASYPACSLAESVHTTHKPSSPWQFSTCHTTKFYDSVAFLDWQSGMRDQVRNKTPSLEWDIGSLASRMRLELPLFGQYHCGLRLSFLTTAWYQRQDYYHRIAPVNLTKEISAFEHIKQPFNIQLNILLNIQSPQPQPGSCSCGIFSYSTVRKLYQPYSICVHCWGLRKSQQTFYLVSCTHTVGIVPSTNYRNIHRQSETH